MQIFNFLYDNLHFVVLFALLCLIVIKGKKKGIVKGSGRDLLDRDHSNIEK